MSNTSATDKNNEHPSYFKYEEECGWYTLGGQTVELSTVMALGGIKMVTVAPEHHINPYGYENLSPHQKRAVDYAKKMNTECPTIFKKLYDTLRHFFGNRKDNETNGLYKQYDRIYYAIKFHLENYQQCNELIGLILWGADVTHPEVKITDYTKPDGDTITLTIQSICYNLLKKHITDEHLDSVCSGKLSTLYIEDPPRQNFYSPEWGQGLYNQ